MRRPVLVLTLLSSVLCRSALASEPPSLTAVPEGEDRIVAVKAGEPAPYAGQLLDRPTAIRWSNWLEQCHVRLKLDSTYDAKLALVDREFYERKLQLQQQQYTQVTTDLRLKLSKAEDEARNPPWYKTPVFGAVVGIVGAVLVVGGTAALVNAVK